MKRKRKKIIIFTIISLLIAIGIIFVIRKIFVTDGEKMDDIVYRSDNLIVHIAKQGGKGQLVILGSGYSLSINENNQIVDHDPFMVWPSMSVYKEDTTVMSIYYPFECSGLESAGKELSNFINTNLEEYDEITLIGHSKCGVCFANATKWIDKKVNIITVSAPFFGTHFADKKNFSKELNFFEKMAYDLIFSNHNVDKDLVPNSKFMQNADYSGLTNHIHINIISICPERSFNPIEAYLIYIDRKGKIFGDGLVPKISQQISFSNTISEEINATHASSLDKSIEEIIGKYVPNIVKDY